MVVVLSAILHELTWQELHELATIIKLINCVSTVILLIREPLIMDSLIKKDITVIPSKELEIYKNYHSSNHWNNEITFINYCFLKSYGEQSWDREKYEGRFTFTREEMCEFIEECGCELDMLEFEKDEFYKGTLPYGIYDKINYTSTLILAR